MEMTQGLRAERGASGDSERFSQVSLAFDNPATEADYVAHHNRRALVPLRVLLAFGALVTAGGAVVDIDLFGAGAMTLTAMRFVVAAGMLCALAATWAPVVSRRLQSLIGGGATAVHVAWLVAVPYIADDVRPYFGAMALNLTLTFVGSGLLWRWATAIGPVALLGYWMTLWTLDPAPLANMFFLAALFVIAAFACYTAERARRAAWAAAQALDAEKKRSEDLLLNVLPGSVADRMRAGETVIADRHDEACVLFADIVGFTPLSASMKPEELVAILDDVFTRFDAIADELDLEKIKTIGDAYMMAAGLPTERAPTPERAGEAALRMRDALAEVAASTGHDLTMRAGIHFGPVVAGVIGRSKFIYDLWGDSVNVASRMESTAPVGEIQVTEAVFHRLHSAYTFEERGEIEVKGKGPTRTWLLTGRRAV